MAEANPPTKVLCLHGCNQSEAMFQSLLKGWKKILAQHNLELHYIQGAREHHLGNYTWYEEDLDVDQIGVAEYHEELVKPCLERVHSYIHENGITALLGFSQGGNVIDTYLSQYEGVTPIQRAVILSGYELVDPGRKALATPLLSYYSEADTIVPARFRPKNYENLIEVAHDNGHKLPKGNPAIRKLCNFLGTGEF